ncbi:unnamed protein product, partial [Allacma fusca]
MKTFASGCGFRCLLGCLNDILVSNEEPKIILNFKEFSIPLFDVFKSFLGSYEDTTYFIEMTVYVITLFVRDMEIYSIFQVEGVEEVLEIEIMKQLLLNSLDLEMIIEVEDYLYQ